MHAPAGTREHDLLSWVPMAWGAKNANGLLLLTLCSDESLTITNTLCKQPEIHKVT